MKHFIGLMAAAFTPFKENSQLNLKIIHEYVDRLISDGLKGVFICGSNGEGPNMTLDERMQVAEAFVKAANKRIQVIIHVGHSCIGDAQKLAAHAQSIGANAISAVACFYFKPVSINNLVSSLSAIAEAAPDLPFYYYHIPHLTGVAFDMLQFLEEADGSIPNLAGIKYTASKLHEFQACTAYRRGQYDILFGMDELLLPALSVGACGAIGSTYTFAAPFYYQMMRAFNASDLETAKELHLNLLYMIQAFSRYPAIAAQKAIMKMQGIDLGPSRLPLQNLTAQDYKRLKSELEQLEFWVGDKQLLN